MNQVINTEQLLKIINETATIVNRYEKLNEAATKAEKGIKELEFNLFAGFLTTEQMQILKQAKDIIIKIQSNSGFHDALYYTKNQLIEQHT
ncbi:MAG: hypothetical protein IPO78_17280 [Saprospiraceae bacterium]|nr:hypothetical protein [Saprospiraceae bacterium]